MTSSTCYWCHWLCVGQSARRDCRPAVGFQSRTPWPRAGLATRPGLLGSGHAQAGSVWSWDGACGGGGGWGVAWRRLALWESGRVPGSEASGRRRLVAPAPEKRRAALQVALSFRCWWEYEAPFLTRSLPTPVSRVFSGIRTVRQDQDKRRIQGEEE